MCDINDWSECIPIIVAIGGIITSMATLYFVRILKKQYEIQKRDQEARLRPIVVLDKNDIRPAMDLDPAGDHARLTVRLINMGSVPTGRIRIIMLPIDSYTGHRDRWKAFKDYINKVGDGKLESMNGLCRVFIPVRERRMQEPNRDPIEKYLMLGDDLKRYNEAYDKIDGISDLFHSKKYTSEGLNSNEILSKLSPADWSMFYLVGLKYGDVMDVIGAADWENFDTEHGPLKYSDICRILGDDAKEMIEGQAERERIIKEMKDEDRVKFYEVLERRREAWATVPKEKAVEYVKADMDLRKTYRSTKEVKVRLSSTRPQNHPVNIYMVQDWNDQMKTGIAGYFGVAVQYATYDSDKFEFKYYVQGYIENGKPVVDYAENEWQEEKTDEDSA